MLAVSQVVMSCYERAYPAQRSDQARVVVHNGIDLERFERRSTAFDQRARLSLDVDIPLVGMAGAYPDKGMDVFVHAAVRVREAVPTARFLVAGDFRDAAFEREMTRLLETSGLHDCVHCIGYQDEIAPTMAACDVWTLPTRLDAFPMVALEAMALGKPVVASRVGGLPEIVAHDETGVLVPPGDVDELARALVRLLGDAPLRARYGRSARRKIAAEFGLAGQMELLEATLQDVIARRSSGVGLVS